MPPYGGRPLLLLSAAVLASAACDQPPAEPQTPDVVIRDSAGIEIVENHAPVWGPGDFWTVAPEPEFSLGGYDTAPGPARDSSHLIWNIRAAAPLSDGRIVMLAPMADWKVLVFEPSGAFSASFGRTGRGPGELNYPLHLRVLEGDTIVVWDYMSGPIYHYDPAGSLLKESRIDVRALSEATRSADVYPGESMHQPLPDGSFLLERRRADFRRPTRAGVIYRRPTEWVRIDSDYAMHSFGWWEAEEELSMRDPFDPNWVPFPTNSSAVAGGDPLSVYITNGDRYEVHQFTPAGEAQRIVRRTHDPAPISDEQIGEWVEVMESLNPDWNWTAWEQVFGTVGRRNHAPVSSMFVDSEGFLWIPDHRRWNAADETTELNVFDPAGRWLGNVDLAYYPYWIGKDFIIGGRSDRDLGVLTIAGFRLDRRGRLGEQPPG